MHNNFIQEPNEWNNQRIVRFNNLHLLLKVESEGRTPLSNGDNPSPHEDRVQLSVLKQLRTVDRQVRRAQRFGELLHIRGWNDERAHRDERLRYLQVDGSVRIHRTVDSLEPRVQIVRNSLRDLRVLVENFSEICKLPFEQTFVLNHARAVELVEHLENCCEFSCSFCAWLIDDVCFFHQRKTIEIFVNFELVISQPIFIWSQAKR